MNYTEEDIRNAFKAGLTKGKHKSYYDTPLDENEYLKELKQALLQACVIKSVCDCGIPMFDLNRTYCFRCKAPSIKKDAEQTVL